MNSLALQQLSPALRAALLPRKEHMTARFTLTKLLRMTRASGVLVLSAPLLAVGVTMILPDKLRLALERCMTSSAALQAWCGACVRSACGQHKRRVEARELS